MNTKGHAIDETPAADPEHVVQDATAKTLKKNNPKMYEAVTSLIVNHHMTHKQVDQWIHNRFGLRKGNIIRDMCFLTAKSIERAHAPKDKA